MPQTNEGVLLMIGAAFFLIGLLGGGLEISAIKVPSVGKWARVLSGTIGVLLIGVGLVQIVFAPAAVQPLPPATDAPTLPPTGVSVPATQTPIPPTNTAAPPADTPVPAIAQTATPAPIPAATADPTTASTESDPTSAAGWERVSDLPRSVNALVASPRHPAVVYAGTGSSGAGSGVYRSDDGGLRWAKTSSGLPSEDVRALAFSRNEPTAIFAAVGRRGDVYASTDGASTWMRLGQYELTGFQAQLRVAPTNPNLLFVAEDVRGLYRSLDGGRTWMEVGEGLPRDENDVAKVQSVAIDPQDASVVYVGTGWGSFNGNGVYKSTDGGDTWTPANRGMIDYGITALAPSPTNPETIYAGGTRGELFKSVDGASTWTELTDRLPYQQTAHQRVSAILIDPNAPDTIYVLHERAGVLSTVDGGATWRHLGRPADTENPTFTALTVLFHPASIVVAGIREEGAWRYAAP